MMIKTIASLAVMLSVGCATAAPQEFFVSPKGNDRNPGSSSRPFKTFEKAREAVAAVIPVMEDDITVIFADGVYPIRETVCFTPVDSPKDDFTITYKAAPGKTPIFTGGIPVKGWTRHDETLWKAPLKRDHKLRALYVNDSRAVMAHSDLIRSQGGWGEYVVTAGQADWAWVDGQKADGVKYRASDLPEIIRNPSDVEIENQATWNKNFMGVREIVREGDSYVFKLQQPYGAIAQQIGWGAGLRLKGTHIIHNAFELLDEPGEFYFDRKKQTVYYYPRAGEIMSSAEVIAPVTETLLRIDGTVPDGLVKNLIFDGLTFAHTDYNLMTIAGSVGKATVQTSTIYTAFANSNWHYDVYRAYDVLPGAIIVNGAENVEFIRNTITHTGCEALALNNGINQVRVIGNTIRDAGGSAIVVGHPQHVYENDAADFKHPKGVGLDKEKYQNGTEAAPRDVVIANNFLPQNAVLFNGHTVITTFFTDGLLVEHNWIPNAPYSGMNIGWGWCDFDGATKGDEWRKGSVDRPSVFPNHPTTVSKNNIIRANRIENTMDTLHDGGGIYTLGNMPGSVIEYNYVRKTSQAIYTDEGSGHIICRYNVIEDPFKNAHYGDGRGRKHHLTVTNYFLTRDKTKIGASDSVSKDHTVCDPTNWPAAAQAIIDASGLEDEWKYLGENWAVAEKQRKESARIKLFEAAVRSGHYEAEMAELSGGAKVNTNHDDFSGTGFVDGYHSKDSAAARFTVKVSKSGSYTVTVRYAAGYGDCTTVGLYVNGQKVKTLSCPKTGGWDAWADHSEMIELTAGLNTITLKAESASADVANFDYLQISK